MNFLRFLGFFFFKQPLIFFSYIFAIVISIISIILHVLIENSLYYFEKVQLWLLVKRRMITFEGLAVFEGAYLALFLAANSLEVAYIESLLQWKEVFFYIFEVSGKYPKLFYRLNYFDVVLFKKLRAFYVCDNLQLLKHKVPYL